jgi:hypothetical protein
MKKLTIVLIAACCLGAASCRAKRGCPTNGRSIGAERLLGGDKATMKAVKKARKFRA